MMNKQECIQLMAETFAIYTSEKTEEWLEYAEMCFNGYESMFEPDEFEDMMTHDGIHELAYDDISLWESF